MFNQNDERKAVPVQLALSDGRFLEGNLMLPFTVDVMRVLNADGASVEFESNSGTRSLIAKSAIVEIVLSEAPNVRTPDVRSPEYQQS